jgi:hypothetical protein
VITICVESDEEQWAIGTALVNGAIGFGNWPYEVRRLHRSGPGGSGGYSPGGSGTTIGGAAAGGGRGAPRASGGTGAVSGTAGAGGGGLSVAAPDYRWSLSVRLRTCCATVPPGSHLGGCDEAGRQDGGG